MSDQTPRKRKKRTTLTAGLRESITRDLKSGIFTCEEIAIRNGVSYPTVRNVKREQIAPAPAEAVDPSEGRDQSPAQEVTPRRSA